jgi:integrase
VKGEGWEGGKRKSVYAAIGLAGELTARDARTKAKECLIRISRGMPAFEAEAGETAPTQATTEAEPMGVTLLEAWDRYRVAHMERKGRSARTIASYADHVERIFRDWRDTALRTLGEDPALVAAKHDAITAANGPYIANGAMRTLRALYNHARKTHRYLPADNPVDAIDWNEETRRDTGMGPRELPGWFDELFFLENPLRREFHLFSLLSACRPGALKIAEIEHLDLRRRALHIPAPKGGSKKAFDIPLSRPMIRCLIRAIRLSRAMHPEHATRWIFAADSESGHIAEQKEDRSVLSKWANDLRQTFRTMAQSVEVPDLDIHILMNHALAGVNAGYITRSALMEGHLRRQQEKISMSILGAVEGGKGRCRAEALAWLRSSRIDSSEPSAADLADVFSRVAA